MEEKKDWILNNIHLKEGGIEDLLLEFSHAVIEDYQEKTEDDETLTRIPIAKKIDEEVYNLVQQELDRAREEGYKKGRDKIDKSTPEQKEEWEEEFMDVLETFKDEICSNFFASSKPLTDFIQQLLEEREREVLDKLNNK